MATKRPTFILLSSLALTVLATPARARQVTTPKGTGWVVELHVASMPDKTPSTVVTSQLPAQGPTFHTGNNSVDTSRQVPSWYFGDGAVIANAVANRFAVPRVVPIDPLLTNAATSTTMGTAVGLRVGHTITSHVVALFAYDQVSTNLALTSASQATLTASSNSFATYWNQFLPTPGLSNTGSTSNLTVVPSSGRERLMSFEADVRAVSLAGFTPYLALGGGIALPLPTVQTNVSLVGNYHTTVTGTGAVLNETDQVQVRYEVQPAPFGMFGVGVERDLQRHLGVRIDLRVFTKVNDIRTRLDTQPISGPTPPPTGAVRAGGTPDIQISTTPARQTSLSLQGVNHFDSFEGTGNLSTVSAGVYFRF
jgi:hypothetical protein